MKTIEIGKTGIVVPKSAIGCLPLQRIPKEDAAALLRKAYDNGFRYFDTARAYSDSEEKLGYAFAGMREKIFIGTKSMAQTGEAFKKDLEMSLKMLQTDYIDVMQFHNPAFCPMPGGADGLYDAALEAKAQGKIRHIGITNHRLNVANEAIDSGLYDTLQFPYSYLSGAPEKELVAKCKAAGMGFFAMKALAGGLINNGYIASAFMDLPENDIVVPLWGVQKECELDEFIDTLKNGAEMKPEYKAVIDKDVAELSATFCRGCGYCMPCPVEISIRDCARMSLMLRRAPSASWLTEKWQTEMKKIENCLHCNQCASKCPYGLDTPNVLKANYDDYWTFLADFNSKK